MEEQTKRNRIRVEPMALTPEIVKPTYAKRGRGRPKRGDVKRQNTWMSYEYMTKTHFYCALQDATGMDKMEICKRAGISLYQLTRIRRMEKYKAEVAKQIGIFTAAMSSSILGEQKRRLAIRDELYTSMEAIREKRKVQSVADPKLAEQGGETGLVVREVSFDRRGNEIIQYKVDHPTVDQIKDLMDRTAKDLGQLGGNAGNGVSVTINLSKDDQGWL